uniref:Interleukin 27 n=1 Tax=Pan troglodytes TaxID=9598 RepID=H2QAU5_PANTR
MGQTAGDLGWRLSLLLLPLLLVQAGVWGFPRPPGRPQLSLQELRREFTVSLHLARKLLSKVRGQAHRFAESHLQRGELYRLPWKRALLEFHDLQCLDDPERLCFISTTLQPFHALLGGLGTQGRWTNMERMQLWAMRLDLRDLQRHLRFRVECCAADSNLPEGEKKIKEKREEERKGLLQGAMGRRLKGAQVSWPQSHPPTALHALLSSSYLACGSCCCCQGLAHLVWPLGFQTLSPQP